MPATLHATNGFNVRASLAAYIGSQIVGTTLPSWLSSVNVVYTMPQSGIVPPCISLFHLGDSSRPEWQGNNTDGTAQGQRVRGLLDVSCWASRRRSDWSAQLSLMRALCTQAVIRAGAGIAIYDYVTTPNTPTLTGFVVRLGELTGQAVEPDENPDIERARYTLDYWWVERA